MTRQHLFLATALAAIASLLGIASAQGSTPGARAATSPTVRLHHTMVGTILVSSSGHTLYSFTRDHPRSDSCVKISKCAHAWPALETTGKPTAAAGVKASLLSTITLSGGVKQVTYAGHPLYLFRGDEAGATEYVGVREFGGSWDAVTATGHMVS
jgi:predicted lipoprotein with Yx(FWY)xxD motif